MKERIFVLEEQSSRFSDWVIVSGQKYKKLAISELKLFQEISRINKTYRRYRIREYIPFVLGGKR